MKAAYQAASWAAAVGELQFHGSNSSNLDTFRAVAGMCDHPTEENLTCSAVDQGEYVYDWKKTRSDHLQCEFVEFSPI
ncbi:hypothetical protein [Rhizobium mongolense]|uniref:hypothetical protein n=1 Tax=Rhizobium mongolense TaxID=57676 RepID=UPI0034A177C2